jgi:hypothetical protein
MLKKIKINFIDFWDNFDINDNVFVNCLSSSYDISIDENPDYLFYSTFGTNHLKYKNCIKIYYTGENDVPDFNFCDYAIGFQHIQFEDRYLRYPLYLLYQGYKELRNKCVNKDLADRKFCNFVYSNAKYSTPLREQFFLELSKYKKVDSGGKLHNNIGKPVENKINFIRDYKFTISFENSALSGYTTEKILEPMTVNSVPIYWGSPTVQCDFNKDSFICIQDYGSIEKAIEEIIRLDNDDTAYLQKLSIPWQTEEQLLKDWEFELNSFLGNIFDQPLGHAKRTSIYGYIVAKKIKEAKWARFATFPLIRNL